MNSRGAKFQKCDLLILLLVGGVLLNNYIWLKIDGDPVGGHELLGLIPAVQAYKELKGLKDSSYDNPDYDKILGRYNGSIVYPPLSFLIVILYYFLFGLQGQMVLMVNSIYIILTLVSVYLIAKEIFNERIGLLSAFILFSFPGYIGFSRCEYWIEFGMMAYVTLVLYFLLKTENFENRRYSILLGISLSLALLHKYEFVPFVIGPLLLVVYKSGMLKDVLKVKWSGKITNFILVLIVASVLSAFWWWPYGKLVFDRMFSAAIYDGRISCNIPYLQKTLSAESLTYYLYSMRFLTGNFFLALFFSMLTFMIIKVLLRTESWFYILYLILSVIIPYIILTALVAKERAHILSALPSMAILIGAGLYFIKNKLFKIITIGSIFLYSLNLHLCPFYHIKIRNALTHCATQLKFSPIRYFFTRAFTPSWWLELRRESLEVGINEILEYIERDSLGWKISPKVLVLFKRWSFKNRIFEYYNLIGNYQFKFFSFCMPLSSLSEPDYIVLEGPVMEDFGAEILSRDYFAWDPESANFKKTFKNGIKGFELIRTYKVPNGVTDVFIYKRKI